MTNQMSAMSYIDKLTLILVWNRRQIVAQTQGKSVFFTPGGKREPGESDRDALCREVREELGGVDLIPSTIRAYGTFEAQAFGKPAGTRVRMTCYAAECDGAIEPSAEVEELCWIRSDFSYDLLSVTGIMILEDLKAQDIIN